jgi:hypothetical protein
LTKAGGGGYTYDLTTDSGKRLSNELNAASKNRFSIESRYRQDEIDFDIEWDESRSLFALKNVVFRAGLLKGGAEAGTMTPAEFEGKPALKVFIPATDYPSPYGDTFDKDYNDLFINARGYPGAKFPPAESDVAWAAWNNADAATKAKIAAAYLERWKFYGEKPKVQDVKDLVRVIDADLEDGPWRSLFEMACTRVGIDPYYYFTIGVKDVSGAAGTEKKSSAAGGGGSKGAPAKAAGGEKVTLSAADLKRFNIFLSNFTEQSFYDFDVKTGGDDELIHLGGGGASLDLIRFGIYHNYINYAKSRIGKCKTKNCEWGPYTLDGKHVVETVKKYFDLGLKNASATESDPPFYFDGKLYHFDEWAALSEGTYYADTKEIVKESGGVLRAKGEIYNVKNTKDRPATFEATAKPYKYGGKNTWAILSFAVNWK